MADVEGAFSSTDTPLQPDGLPLAVEAHLSVDVDVPLRDHHPNATGYGVMAHAFLDATP